jgi:hypothetical protein
MPSAAGELEGGAVIFGLGKPAAKSANIAGVKCDAIELDHPVGGFTSDPFLPWAGHL